MKRSKKLLPLLMLLLPLAAASAQAPGENVKKEISSLLARLESSQCQFNRNGSWYSSSDAKVHLTKKYNYLAEKGLISTTQSFIQQAASKSSMSGKPYFVKCGQEKPVESALWLSNQLIRQQ